MGLEEEASLASLMEEAEEMEAAQLAALQEEQAARDAKPRWANLFGPEAVGRPAKAWEYDLFGRHDHPCQGLLAPAGLVLGFTGLLLEEALPWEVASRGGEPLELKGTWKHVSVWGKGRLLCMCMWIHLAALCGLVDACEWLSLPAANCHELNRNSARPPEASFMHRLAAADAGIQAKTHTPAAAAAVDW